MIFVGTFTVLLSSKFSAESLAVCFLFEAFVINQFLNICDDPKPGR